MAAPRSSLAMILAGTLLFGVLTFLLGLLIGVNVAPPAAVSALSAAKPALPAVPSVPAVPSAPAIPSAPAAVAPAPAAPPAQGGSSAGGGAAPSPAAPAKSSAAEPPPAVKPVKVKGLGYGAPPSVEPASSLRGKLMQQADAPATDAVAPDAAKEAPKDTAKDAGPALVYAVSLGRFLVEANAGRLYAKAQEKGYQPVVVVPDPPDPTGWLTVTLGPQADATAANRLATDASAQGFETWLVTWQAQ